MGYFVLCEFGLGRFIAAIFIVFLTTIDEYYGILAVLLYMCLQVMYSLDFKYKHFTNYVEEYYMSQPTTEILTHNADPMQSIISAKDYTLPIANNDNLLFEANNNILDEKINYENVSTRNPLNRVMMLDFYYSSSNSNSSNNKNRRNKISPSTENFENPFQTSFMNYVSPTHGF
jgi:hypothetical protein